MKRFRVTHSTLWILLVAVGVAFAWVNSASAWLGDDDEPPVIHSSTIPDIAERTVRGVVNIASTRSTSPTSSYSPFHSDPLFRHFFGRRHQGLTPSPHRSSLGSGVLVSEDGLVVTNYHVVEDAERVRVTLHDGRELTAELVGGDAKTDLAVLKLRESVEGLEPLSWGDASALRLGETVLAIGNPFGVGQTVTKGIVSATGRSNVGIVDYENFIQTDAAINPGNSGGALISMDGQLVGINTAILSRSGGYQGIGFAIPADMARSIVDSLVTDGRVRRGLLGVRIQDVDAKLARALSADASTRGALVAEVDDDSAAAEAGLQSGDIVVRFDGRAITSSAVLRNQVAATTPGKTVEVVFLRKGKEIQREVELHEQVSDNAVTTLKPSSLDWRGLSVERSTRPRGLRVTRVEPGSAAARAGIEHGDTIVEVNRRAVRNRRDLLARAGDRESLVLLSRRGVARYVVVPSSR